VPIFIGRGAPIYDSHEIAADWRARTTRSRDSPLVASESRISGADNA